MERTEQQHRSALATVFAVVTRPLDNELAGLIILMAMIALGHSFLMNL
jgi:hypothetical protein